MSQATTSLSDTLPSSVPKLDASGMNWAIFAVRFQDAIEAKGFWGHFDGSSKRPVPLEATDTKPVAGEAAEAPAAKPVSPTAEELQAVKLWDKDELSAKSLLTQKIPDSTLMRIHSKKTVFERWAAIEKEYTEKGAYAQTDMRARFLESKCPEKGNVREFLDNLRVKREELASVGVEITEQDYRSTIISSLPYSLANFASAQLAAARMFATSKTIDPDALISLISEEYERQRTQQSRRTGKSKSDDPKDEAMAVGSSRGKGRFKGDRKPRGACWNCGEKGHFKDKCPKPLKSSSHSEKDTKNPKDSKGKKPDASANAVDDSDDDSDDAFAVNCETESEAESDDSMPGLQSVSRTSLGSSSGDVESDVEDGIEVENGADWFSEVGSDAGDYEDARWGVSDDDTSDFEGPGTEEASEDEVGAYSNEEQPSDAPRIEIFDSGTTKHISPYKSDFTSIQATPPRNLRAANKHKFSAVGIGELTIDVPNGTDSSKLELHEVLYSPEVGYTLISIGRLDDHGFITTFGNGKCIIRGPDGDKVAEIPKDTKGLYRLEHDESVNAAVERISLDQFHRRMGHISPVLAKKLVKDKFVTGVRLTHDDSGDPWFCESCVYAKATRKSIPKEREGERAKEFGGEIHSDLWGPAPVETKQKKRYYITFTDDKTRFTALYLLVKKSDAFEAYLEFEQWCETQLGARIKVLHIDRGGEYMSDKFIAHLKARGTVQKLTVHDTPQHNGVAERRNRTILERVRALLHASGLPRFLWGEAARHVVWLLNRTSTKAVDDMTPLESAFGTKPDVREVREWGEKVWVRTETKGFKLGGRVKEGRWVGIDENSKGFRVYWPDKKTVSVERNVYFNKAGLSDSRLEGEDWEIIETKSDEPASETITNTSQPLSTIPPVSTNVPPPKSTSDNDSEAPNEPQAPRRSTRDRKPSQRARDILEGRAVTGERTRRETGAKASTLGAIDENMKRDGNFGLEGESDIGWAQIVELELEDECAMAAEAQDVEGLEPRTLNEAKTRPDWPLWEKAIHEELGVLREAGTWKLVEQPTGANIVGSKWVFRAKKDASGKIVRYKARLVAQGFSQVPGVDYFDTFAPVARLSSIRAALAIAAVNDYEIHQIDVKGAYLNGVLTENEAIYMRQPPGYPDTKSPPNYVCRLQKTLYGLKQSGRRWYQKLVEIMNALKFTRCDVDQAVFFKHTGKSQIIVLVHVDDCTIIGTTLLIIQNFKSDISKHVDITDLGELTWILGIEVRRDRRLRTIHLSQRSYIESIIRRYGFEDAKPLSLPMDPNTRLSSTQSPSTTEEFARMRDVPYHEAVGSLMYASLGTRPDITYAVQCVSRFASKPGLAHWDAVKRIFRYLKGTLDLWLTYGAQEKKLIGYTDADGSMAEDRHAISGYAFLLHGGAVSWTTKRQEIISLSTTESEYVAITHASKEAIWLRSLISQIFSETLTPTTLFSDNQSAIALTKDHQYHARTKHIDIRFHFIRWIVENGSMSLVYCPTNDMLADSLTKALPSPKVKHFATELGLVRV